MINIKITFYLCFIRFNFFSIYLNIFIIHKIFLKKGFLFYFKTFKIYNNLVLSILFLNYIFLFIY